MLYIKGPNSYERKGGHGPGRREKFPNRSTMENYSSTYSSRSKCAGSEEVASTFATCEDGITLLFYEPAALECEWTNRFWKLNVKNCYFYTEFI